MPSNLHINDPVNTRATGKLYVVATPIGNLDDITIRALNVLGQVDLIAAEDTRHTGKLLARHAVKGRLMSYHEHNERERTFSLIEKLKSGASVALVSNAGTPSVSDPGYRLVKEAVANNISVIPIPGASAAVTALSVSGLPTDTFIFIGFPAKKRARRIHQIETLAGERGTIIFFESARRIQAFLKELIHVLGDRYGVLCREMTKLHEEFLRGSLFEIHLDLSRRPAVKGECTLLVAGCGQEEAVCLETVRDEIRKSLELPNIKPSDISKTIAKKYGLSKNVVYEETLKIQGKRSIKDNE